MTPADLRALIEKAKDINSCENYAEWMSAVKQRNTAFRILAPHVAALWEAHVALDDLPPNASLRECFRKENLVWDAADALTAAAREQGGKDS